MCAKYMNITILSNKDGIAAYLKKDGSSQQNK